MDTGRSISFTDCGRRTIDYSIILCTYLAGGEYPCTHITLPPSPPSTLRSMPRSNRLGCAPTTTENKPSSSLVVLLCALPGGALEGLHVRDVDVSVPQSHRSFFLQLSESPGGELPVRLYHGGHLLMGVAG